MKTKIVLTKEELQNFDASYKKMMAAEETAQMMSKQLQGIVEEARGLFNDAFAEVGKAHGLDLAREQWSYNPANKTLELKSAQF